MRDVLYVLITLAFFALCVGLVRACDALIGPDPEEVDDGPAEAAADAEPEMVMS